MKLKFVDFSKICRDFRETEVCGFFSKICLENSSCIEIGREKADTNNIRVFT